MTEQQPPAGPPDGPETGPPAPPLPPYATFGQPQQPYPYPYPQQPHPYAYGYAYSPPPRSNKWLWISLAAVGGVLVVALIGGFFWMVGVMGDPGGFDDEGYWVDDSAVIEAIEQPCEDLHDAVDEVDLLGPEAATDLQKLADLSRGIQTAITEADPDEDARLMAADWGKLAGSLELYASGTLSPYELPEVDDERVDDRIYWGNDECYVPIRLVVLDADAADDVGDYFYEGF